MMNLKSFFTDAQIEQIKSYVNVDESSAWLREHALALSIGAGIGFGIGLIVKVNAMALASSQSASHSLLPETSNATDASPASTQPTVTWPENLSANVQDLVLFAQLVSPQTLSKALCEHYAVQRYPGLRAPSAFVDVLLTDARFVKVGEAEELWQLAPNQASPSSPSTSASASSATVYSLMLDAALAVVKQLATVETPMDYYAYAQTLHTTWSVQSGTLSKTQCFQLGQSLHAWARVELQQQQAKVAKAHLEMALTLFKAHYGELHIEIVPILEDLAKAHGQLDETREQLAVNRQIEPIIKAYEGTQTPRYQQLAYAIAMGSSRVDGRVTVLEQMSAFHQTYYGALSHPMSLLITLQISLAQRQLAPVASAQLHDSTSPSSTRVVEAEQQLEQRSHFGGTENIENQVRNLIAQTKQASLGTSASSLMGMPPSTPTTSSPASSTGSRSPSPTGLP